MRKGLRRGKALMRRTRLKARQSQRIAPTEQIARQNWRRAVCGSNLCAVTGLIGTPEDRIEGHHVISKQALRKRGLAGKFWDPRNGMPVLSSVHARHTAAFERIPFEALPESVFEFARELELEWLLERDYPRTRGGETCVTSTG